MRGARRVCGVCAGPAWSRLCQRCSSAAQAAWEAYVDEVAVDRLVMGDPPARSTRAERQEAVRVLTARGLPDSQIAARLRVCERTVARLRNRCRADGQVAA